MSLTDTPPEFQPKSSSGLKSILPYTTVAVIIAALYVAYTFYSRYDSNRRAQEAADAAKQEALQKQNRAIFGSGEVSFTTFGADDAYLKPGQSTQLCYGVVNASAVKIEPALSEAPKVSPRHCVEIAPKKTTTYTITASDAKGNSKTESITVQVR